jgi:phenylalanyl-tRNA synthetase alpha chain
MKEKIDALQKAFREEIGAVSDLSSLEAVRVKYLGRKGQLSELTKEFPKLPQEQKAGLGQAVSGLKNEIQSAIQEKENEFAGGSKGCPEFDVTLDPANKIRFSTTAFQNSQVTRYSLHLVSE